MHITRRRILQTGLLGSFGGLTPSALATENPAPAGKRLRGIVFLVSDGMSHGVLPLAEALSLQTRNKPTRWWELLGVPGAVHGMMDTPSSDSLVTDSAAACSAWSSGQRVPNGHINISDKGAALESIGETLASTKVRLGLVTTSTITHATPAGFAANTPDRNDEDAIAPQFLGRAEIVLGGGSKFFDPAKRKDKKDLFGDYGKAGYAILRNRDQLLAAREPRLLGTFTEDHLPYTVDRDHDDELAKTVPTLAEMTHAALDRFLPGDAPFLLQVEGARIDHAAHGNDIAGLLHDQIAFDDALAAVLEATAGRDDILVIVTSDHGNANPGLNGTGARYTRTDEHFARVAKMKMSHERLLSVWNDKPGNAAKLRVLIEDQLGFEPTSDEAEALVAVFADRPVIEWSHQLANPPGILGQIVGNHTGIGWTGVSHTADPTLITATGPGAETFAGLVRNDAVRDKLLGLLPV